MEFEELNIVNTAMEKGLFIEDKHDDLAIQKGNYPLVIQYSEVERSTMLFIGKLTNFRLGHFQVRKQQAVMTRG